MIARCVNCALVGPIVFVGEMTGPDGETVETPVCERCTEGMAVRRRPLLWRLLRKVLG